MMRKGEAVNMRELLKIVICDDEETAISIISASVEALFRSWGVSVEIRKYVSAKACYEYIAENYADLLFLDISMPECDGIEMAKRMTESDMEQCPDIVFVSSNQERVFDSFQVRPFGFVRKDQFMQDVSGVCRRYFEKRIAGDERNKKFELRDGHGISVLQAESIIYIESYRNTQTVYLNEEKIVILHSTMEQVTSQVLEFDFIRIHKGYIVGCMHIRKFGRKEVVLDNGITLPVGRMYYKDAMEKYMSYIRIKGIKGIG